MNTNIYKAYYKIRPWYCPALLVALWAFTGISHPRFLKITNLFIVLRQSSYLGILALAMYITVIIGGIDFSIVAIAALTSSICVALMNYQVTIVPAMVLALLIAVCCGLLNGVILSYTKILPYYSTVGTMTLFFCIASLIKSNFLSDILPESFAIIGKGYIGHLPVAVLLLLFIYLITSFVLNHTYYGRYLFALGSNPLGLTFIGINARKYKIFAYILSAFLSGIAGIIWTSRNNYVNIEQDFSYIVDGIFAITLSGTRLKENNAKISGIFLGSFLLCSITKCLNLFGVSVVFQEMSCCLLFLITIMMDNCFSKSEVRVQDV